MRVQVTPGRSISDVFFKVPIIVDGGRRLLVGFGCVGVWALIFLLVLLCCLVAQ